MREKYIDYYNARNMIKDIISKDLVGPVLEDEVIIEPPMQYYITGKLYPSNQNMDIIDDTNTSNVESEIDEYDVSLASTNMRNPSSMGITCTLKEQIDKITVDIDFAMYEPLNVEEINRQNINVERWKEDVSEDTVYWVRRKFSHTYTIKPRQSEKVEILSDIFLHGYVHKICDSGEKIFTIVLINNRISNNEFVEINSNMIFQPHIRISSADDNNKRIFTSVMRQVDIKEDDELIELDLLYSQYKCYGQGHGCSVNWGNKEGETEEPIFVESTFIPEYNLKHHNVACIGLWNNDFQ